MDFETVAILFTAVAAFRVVNERFLGMQATIALMAISLTSLIVVGLLKEMSIDLELTSFLERLEDAEPDESMATAILCFFLFSTTMQISVRDLDKEKYYVLAVTCLLLVGTIVITGFLLPWALERVDMSMDRGSAMLFAAVISPTCLSVVMGTLKKAPSPKVAVLAGGEALYAAGLSVLACVIIAETDLGDGGELEEAAAMFFRELLRGAIIGIPLGGVAYFMNAAAKNVATQVLVSLAVVYGCITLGVHNEAQPAVAAMFAGLTVGLSKDARQQLAPVWRAGEEALSAMLFVLIGAHVYSYSSLIVPSAVAVIVVLAARAGAVALSNQVFGIERRLSTKRFQLIKFLTWGGLRGGFSMALALAIPDAGDEEILIMVYGVVAFSLIVQGLTINRI